MSVERNQITDSLGNDYYWLSIVECKSDNYHIKELALVEDSPRSFFGISLVPLREWYDDSSRSCEQTIDLLVGDGLRPVKNESVVLSEAIVKAQEYLSRYWGLELVSENQENN